MFKSFSILTPFFFVLQCLHQSSLPIVPYTRRHMIYSLLLIIDKNKNIIIMSYITQLYQQVTTRAVSELAQAWYVIIWA